MSKARNRKNDGNMENKHFIPINLRDDQKMEIAEVNMKQRSKTKFLDVKQNVDVDTSIGTLIKMLQDTQYGAIESKTPLNEDDRLMDIGINTQGSQTLYWDLNMEQTNAVLTHHSQLGLFK